MRRRADSTGETCCGLGRIGEWAVGWSPHVDARGREHQHDPNLRTCYGCGKQWFKPCWCGWENSLEAPVKRLESEAEVEAARAKLAKLEHLERAMQPWDSHELQKNWLQQKGLRKAVRRWERAQAKLSRAAAAGR